MVSRQDVPCGLGLFPAWQAVAAGTAPSRDVHDTRTFLRSVQSLRGSGIACPSESVLRIEVWEPSRHRQSVVVAALALEGQRHHRRGESERVQTRVVNQKPKPLCYLRKRPSQPGGHVHLTPTCEGEIGVGGQRAREGDSSLCRHGMEPPSPSPATRQGCTPNMKQTRPPRKCVFRKQQTPPRKRGCWTMGGRANLGQPSLLTQVLRRPEAKLCLQSATDSAARQP